LEVNTFNKRVSLTARCSLTASTVRLESSRRPAETLVVTAPHLLLRRRRRISLGLAQEKQRHGRRQLWKQLRGRMVGLGEREPKEGHDSTHWLIPGAAERILARSKASKLRVQWW
jgi:hypothetical protein